MPKVSSTRLYSAPRIDTSPESPHSYRHLHQRVGAWALAALPTRRYGPFARLVSAAESFIAPGVLPTAVLSRQGFCLRQKTDEDERADCACKV